MPTCAIIRKPRACFVSEEVLGLLAEFRRRPTGDLAALHDRIVKVVQNADQAEAIRTKSREIDLATIDAHGGLLGTPTMVALVLLFIADHGHIVITDEGISGIARLMETSDKTN